MTYERSVTIRPLLVRNFVKVTQELHLGSFTQKTALARRTSQFSLTPWKQCSHLNLTHTLKHCDQLYYHWEQDFWDSSLSHHCCKHSTLLLDHSLMGFSSLDIILWHFGGFILGKSIQQPWSSLAIINLFVRAHGTDYKSSIDFLGLPFHFLVLTILKSANHFYPLKDSANSCWCPWLSVSSFGNVGFCGFY